MSPPIFEKQSNRIKLINNIEYNVLFRAKVNFQEQAFINILDQWISSPEQITKLILRGEVLSTEYFNEEKDNFDKTYDLLKTVKLTLLPKRRTLDLELTQTISYYRNNKDCVYIYENKAESASEIPFFIPKVKSYAFIFEREDEENLFLSIGIESFENSEVIDEEQAKKEDDIWIQLLLKLSKYCFKDGNYQKRVHHDVIIPKALYQDTYFKLKEKYKHWADEWPESTDPQKFVFEDISIATWIILLFKQQEEKPEEKELSYKFVDVGCGNGFLVYILNQEGYKGYGIDQSSRKIWKSLPDTDLRQSTITLNHMSFPDVEWIIGNHPDQISPWIPIMASKSHYLSKFIIVPCCFYDLNGEKLKTVDSKLSRYQGYLHYLATIMKVCGYRAEIETLRIPSTKNIALIGRQRTLSDDDVHALRQAARDIILMTDDIEIKYRVPDQEKHIQEKKKKNSRKPKKQSAKPGEES